MLAHVVMRLTDCEFLRIGYCGQRIAPAMGRRGRIAKEHDRWPRART